MFAIIGIVVVFGCVVGGYLMEHGNLRVLLQPAELITIGGAALGTMLIANPLHILKQHRRWDWRRIQWIEVHQTDLHRISENDV